VLDGQRRKDSIAELCRKEEIAQSLYYTWSKYNLTLPRSPDFYKLAGPKCG
jgi:hypothetical protein